MRHPAPAHPSRHDDRASARRAASTSFLDRAAGLAERAPISVVRPRRAPPGRTAERRPMPSSRLSFVAAPPCVTRAGSPEPTRRRRARAEPRARRSLIAPPASSSARRSSSAPRACAAWPHRRAPTDAILTLSFVAAPPSSPAPAHPSRHDDGERAPSREHVVPDRAAGFAERASISVCASRVRRLAARAERRRCLLSAQLRCCSSCVTAPAHPKPTRRPRERAPSREQSSFLIAPPASPSVRRSQSCASRVRPPAARAERRPTPPHVLSFAAAPHASPCRLTESRHDDRASARRAASNRRSLIAPPASSSARRSVSCASRVRRLPHRRAPTDAILSLSFVAAPPSSPRAGSPEPTRRRRARAEPRARRSLIAPPASSSARRSVSSCSACAAWPHRRAPTDVILTLSFVAAPPSHPRRLTEPTRRRASARRAASTSFLDRAAGLVERAPICVVASRVRRLAAPPSADRRHPLAQLRCCSSIVTRAGSPEPTRRRASARRAASIVVP